MNRLVRRYIILILAILIPLTAAFLVGLYGYNSTKFGQSAWKEEFSVEYLTFDEDYTTKQKIERYLEYGVNSQYYSFDPTPVYEEEIKSVNDEKLLDLLIYRVVYDLDAQGNDRFQYVFFFYNVQYKNVRNSFVADESLRKEIEANNVPSFVPKLKSLTEDEEESVLRGITQIPEEQISFPDYEADVDFKSGKNAVEEGEIPAGDTLVKVYIGFVPMRNVEDVTSYNLQIISTIPNILDDTGTSISTEIANINLELEVDPTKVDYSDFRSSYQQDLDKAGYLGWVIKNYLWWICLIAFVAVGLITGSFYLVYISEERRILEQTKKNKKKRK